MAHLALEMQRSAAVKQAESLRKKRGIAAADGDHEAFLVVEKKVEEAERRIQQLENAIVDRDGEVKRRIDADAPRRAAEACAKQLADLKAAEELRLEAIARAEKAARELAGALGEAIHHMKSVRALAGSDDAAFKDINFQNRLAEFLAATLRPIRTASGHFGPLNLMIADHAHLPATVDWAACEKREIGGYIRMLERAAETKT